jgi:hypothetical protein
MAEAWSLASGVPPDNSPSGSTSTQAGFGLVGLLMTMAILALLVVVAVKAIPSGPTSTSGLSPYDVPGGAANVVGGASASNSGGAVVATPNGLIAQAASEAAQASLGTVLPAVDQVATGSGGYGDITVSALQGSVRGASFTAGPSTGASLIGVAAAGGGSGGVALAVRDASGTCWFVWRSNAATWYGAQTGRPSCTAPAQATAPTASAVGSGSIGWQSGSFPHA